MVHDTVSKWCTPWGGAYYQGIVRKNGRPDYVFDTDGRDAIKTICQVNDPHDDATVSQEIHNAAVRRGESYANRMEVMKEREQQRLHLKMMPTKNVQAVREYDKMYDIPGSQDLDRQVFSERHAQQLQEMDAYHPIDYDEM